ncbi:MAG: class II aldolase [Synergistaceae bacterium]|nr:class II aldolase [Synergistaceae bacterium]
MKLINGFELMAYAKERGYILPAFNTTNMEMTYGIVRGLCEADLPGYVQISSNNLRLSNPRAIADLVRDAVEDEETPIGLHLDHGKSFEDVKACIDAGFTSIMIDMSHLPLDENMRESKRIAEYCHLYGLPVEVELGALAGKEDDIVGEEGGKTDPKQVPIFVEGTGCDTLAVAIGNVHGLGLTPQIDIPLLEEIRKVSKVPLVLHGGSGIPEEVVWECKKHGIVKINYGSDLRREFIRTFGQAYEKDHDEFDLYRLSVAAVDAVAKKTCELATMINEH